MNGHASSKHTLNYEETTVLLDEKSLSDLESDAGRADRDTRFMEALGAAPALKWPLLRSLLLRTALFLLPSFLRPHPSPLATTTRPSATAYLDGLRGLAALIVFFCHLAYTCFVIAPG
ncbi:hypothetical protein B0H67DRAFT_643018 [Lasiosphaeris hirsuta]|uniref:Acyltransferase 3 domain-containing protein n=1 Tax=Lasiosphaeris hirsuta TaxID=260670 RepID=A0AA40APM6_9PEZI|nr:hypothetical protein B0H67DRAFT_643018 [Lasiosphaeris hirsuta]